MRCKRDSTLNNLLLRVHPLCQCGCAPQCHCGCAPQCHQPRRYPRGQKVCYTIRILISTTIVGYPLIHPVTNHICTELTFHQKEVRAFSQRPRADMCVVAGALRLRAAPPLGAPAVGPLCDTFPCCGRLLGPLLCCLVPPVCNLFDAFQHMCAIITSRWHAPQTVLDKGAASKLAHTVPGVQNKPTQAALGSKPCSAL
jgi:hypothetical protein